MMRPDMMVELDERRDRPREECGVFGIFNHSEAANMTYLGLYALQHRGQESAGIATTDGDKMYFEKNRGYVADIFEEPVLQKLTGPAAIGHVRYSTSGDTRRVNAQPFLIESYRGKIALVHNGNLINAHQLRASLIKEGSIFISNSDTEVILHLIARSKQKTVEDAIIDALNQVKGAFSLVFLTEDKMIAVRDTRGFRPLTLGKLSDAWIISSETCAFDLIYAKFVRDLEPGEMLIIEKGKEPVSLHPFPKKKHAYCIFEHIYFSRPDSFLFGRAVSEMRDRLGKTLAGEHPVEADCVVPIPDSGVYAALGFAKTAEIPFKLGLIRNHYVGRTFIEPESAIRHFGVKVKLNAVRSIIKGKRVILVDDSIVRGVTSKKIVDMVRAAGAREIHMRITSPPYRDPCFYGIDTPIKDDLIASHQEVSAICKFLGADSLGYLSLEGMLDALGKREFCTACFTGQYPEEFFLDDLAQLRLFEKDVSYEPGLVRLDG
jgi:amidophosphoribosyltransferase